MDRKAKQAGVSLSRCLLCLVMIQVLMAESFCGVEETKNLFAEKECYFRNISTTQGLSQSTVFCIQQDHLGFIWMGTQDGLNRFDGEEFKIFRNQKNDSTSFSSNYVRALFLDSGSNLWIGGDKGISKYSYEKQYFVNYSLPHAPGVWYVSAIAEGPDSTIYVATSSGELYKREPGKAFFTGEKMQWPREGVTSIRSLLKHHDQLFIGTNEGLYVYDLRRKTCELLSLGKNEPMINEVYVDVDVIWIGTEGRGLYRYGPQKGVFVNYVHKPGEQSVITGNDVRSIRADLNGNLWIGTFSGLTIWDTRLNSYRHYHQDPGQPYSMSHNSVRQIYRDRQGGMWLGTYFGGVSYYHPEHIKFNLLTQNRGKLSLTDQVINIISQDDNQNFWIGTNDKGISYWDRQRGIITGYSQTASGTPIFRSNSIKAILQLGDGRLLVGTHNGGLNLFSPGNFANRIFLHNPDDTTTISGDMVYALLRDHRGEIWVGTRSGLDRFDLAAQTFRRFASEHPEQSFSSRTVTFLLEDARRYIWMGTTNGVTRISPDRKEVTAFPGDRFSNDVVTCLAYDQHYLWIGTRNGLNYMDLATGQTGTVSAGDGILEGIISSIQPDEDGLLWISTNRGLVRYDPGTQKKQLFDTRDGLQNNQFILTSSCKASDGLMLFGGINGISYFYPAELRLLSFPLEIRLTALHVLGNEITAEHPFHILEKHINATSSFVLQPDHKQFSFYFNSFNYISPSRVTYLYYLEGYDTDWRIAERDRNASYHNLPPGQYTFHVKAVGPMGESSAEKTVRIKILPPWWKTNLFYFTSVLLAAAGIFFAYKSSTDRLKALHQLRIERMEREKEVEINQMKLDFFTHISHELRTPLTLIKAPLDEIRNGQLSRFRLQKNYDLISRNTERLLALVNELLDFRKLDMKSRPGIPQKTDLIDLAGMIFQSFQLMAENKRISYSFEKQADTAYYSVDKGIFEKILGNLLSNAVKYTPEGGKITLSLETLPEQLILKVADNGIGIDAIYQEQVFEPFFRVNENGESAGWGIGLAFVKELVTSLDGRISLESVKIGGTVVTVTLPLRQEYPAAEPVSIASEPAGSVFVTGDADGILSKLAVLSGEKKKNLLLVDDNPEITGYLKEYFEGQYHIVTAASGSEALPLVERDPFDLILCDVMMPGVDGVTFCDRVKQDVRTCHVPIILLTAKAGISQQIVGIEAGADDYITKPFSIQLLESKISAIIKNRERLKQYHSRSEEIDPAKITLNPLDEALIRKVIAIVEARIEDPEFSVDKLSSEVGMSRSALYLKLRALTGESPSDLVRRIRLGYAARLLKTRQYNVAEVAFRSGFNSPAYFSTSFKQHYGCMPSEYFANLSKKES